MSLEVGAVVEGRVINVKSFGAFIELEGKQKGLLHVSELSYSYIKEVSDIINVDDIVKVKVIGISPDGKIALSMKQVAGKQDFQQRKNTFNQGDNKLNDNNRGKFGMPQKMSFEDMISKFKQTSDEKFLELKRNKDSKRNTNHRRGGH